MTEKEKMLSGMSYNAVFDETLCSERQHCKLLCHEFNNLPPSSISEKKEIIRRLFGSVKDPFLIEQPFHCDYGYNIKIGTNFFANFNLVILDAAQVNIGDNVLIGPNCSFYTSEHPFNIIERNKGMETARPIRVGSNVWLGGNVTVLPGITIGDNCIIGAGSVVTKDIPSNSVAVGNPCRIIKSAEKIDTMKLKSSIVGAAAMVITMGSQAQTLEKMNWFNEPAHWRIVDNSLEMDVTPNTDYWRISHYGFTVDDAPFYYAEYGGEFEAKVKITGEYKVRFDQAGLMIRIDHENYIKTGIEFVDGKFNLSTVVTHKTSDWSVISLEHPIEAIWIKAVRRLDAVEIFYSFDDIEYHMMRNAWMEANRPLKIGMYGASPDGNGFKARFSNFEVTHLPDKVRTDWLEKNAE